MTVKRTFKKGIQLEAQTTVSVAEKGDIQSRDSDGKLVTYDGTVERVLVDQDSTETLTNKDIDADTNTITNIDDNEIKAAAGIQVSKLEALVPDRAVQTDVNGFLDSSVVTSGELAYLSGVTSAIQDQLDAKADQDLSNLTATSINEDLIPQAAKDLGSIANPWEEAHVSSLINIPSTLEIAADAASYWMGTSPAILVDNSTSGLLIGSKDAASDVESTTSVVVATGTQESATGTSQTGGLDLATGDNFGTGASGNFTLYTGAGQKATGPGGNSGSIDLQSGYSRLGQSGSATLATGSIFDATSTTNSGFILVNTGSVTGSGDSGLLIITTGTSASGDTGTTTVSTGNAASGNSGDLTLSTGTASGTRGSIVLDGFTIDANNSLIENVASPLSANDAATKAYVDSVAEGLKPKEAVRVATTANVNLASALENGDTIDGIVLVTGDRVLVKNQTLPENNGIYIVPVSGTATRSTDFDSLTPIDEINGAYVAVQQGTVNAGIQYVQYGLVVTLGSDPINFTFFNSISGLIGGNGIDITGTTLSVDHNGQGLTFTGNQLAIGLDGATLSKSVSGLKVAAGGITNTEVNAAALIDYSKLNSLAINSNIIPAATLTNDLGSATKYFTNTYSDKVFSSDITPTGTVQVAINLFNRRLIDSTNVTAVDWQSRTLVDSSAATALTWTGANLILSKDTVSDGDATRFIGTTSNRFSEIHGIDLYSASLFKGSGASTVLETYIHSSTLLNNNSDVVADFSFSSITYGSMIIEYQIKEATTNACRSGRLHIVSNGTIATFSDVNSETADLGITWAVTIFGNTTHLAYTSTNTGNNRTMRSDIKLFLA